MPKLKLENNLTMYYELEGEGPETVVLVGGLTRDHSIWNDFRKELVKSFRVLVFDNRGAGQTDKPEGPYSTEMLGDDLYYLLKALHLGSSSFVGHSMGGFLLEYLGAKHPEYVKKLVLCSAAAEQPPLGKEYLSERIKLARDPSVPLETSIRSALPWLYTTAFCFEENIARIIDMARRNPYPQPAEALISQAIACLEHNARPVLGSIRCPTLVITGAEDKVMTPSIAMELAASIPGAKCTIIPGAAHMIQIEQRDALLVEVIRFINS